VWLGAVEKIPMYYNNPGRVSRPLLHVLEYGQSPNDFIQNDLQGHQKIALQGQTDVLISRAELDLRKAIQSLAFLSGGVINSFLILTALSLPGTATALFWTIHALLQHQYQKLNLVNPVHHREHDARLLFQQLAQLDLAPWYIHSVNKVAPDSLPHGLQFPLGHPIPGELYRRHPLKARHHCFFSTTSFFSSLFEEREQSLILLLENLGATKIIIEAKTSNDSTPVIHENHRKVFEYEHRPQSSSQAISLQQYPWLAYEFTWQSVVNARLHRGLTATQFELDIDSMGLLRTQLQTIKQLVSELDSMVLSADDEQVVLNQILQPRTVRVEFGNNKPVLKH